MLMKNRDIIGHGAGSGEAGFFCDKTNPERSERTP